MPSFLKLWEKATHKASEGDDNIFYYSCNKNKVLCAVGNREIKPCILLFLIKYKSEVSLAGNINGKFVFYNKDGKVDIEEDDDFNFEVKVIFDDRKKRLLLLFNEHQLVYSEDEIPEEEVKIMVFELNPHYQDAVFYDSKVSVEPAFIMDEFDSLRIIVYSLISEFHSQGKDILKELVEG